jgi:hypothetical protein|tara:strand:+ start:136 stop:681 length:546 start_codon:yes stop_codon:yes gene_type:complete
MIDQQIKEVWEGTVEYYKYKKQGWIGIGGIEHPLYKQLIDNIESRLPEYHKKYDIWVVGGLLQDWLSWDIDLVITGGDIRNNREIHTIMDTIIKCGFDMAMYCDVCYTRKLWDPTVDEVTYSMDKELLSITDKCIINGEKLDLSHYIPEGDLFKRTDTFPPDKYSNNSNREYKYVKPIKLF